MEGSCSTGQSPQRAVVPVEEEEEILRSKRLGKTEPKLPVLWIESIESNAIAKT
jgi:hypothetical protein